MFCGDGPCVLLGVALVFLRGGPCDHLAAVDGDVFVGRLHMGSTGFCWLVEVAAFES